MRILSQIPTAAAIAAAAPTVTAADLVNLAEAHTVRRALTTADILHGPVRAPDSAARRWRRRIVLLWTERALATEQRRSRRLENRIRRARRRRDAARVAYHSARGML